MTPKFRPVCRVIQHRFENCDEWINSSYNNIASVAIPTYSEEIGECFWITGYDGFLAKDNGKEKALAALNLIKQSNVSLTPPQLRLLKVTINIISQIVEE